jgi:hypothetical protein
MSWYSWFVLALPTWSACSAAGGLLIGRRLRALGRAYPEAAPEGSAAAVRA